MSRHSVFWALLMRGTAVPHNGAEAVKWLTRAAEHGIAWVQNMLGSMFHHGAGVSQDFTEAVRWYRAAAEQHHPGAADNLGYMLLKWKGRASGLRIGGKMVRLSG